MRAGAAIKKQQRYRISRKPGSRKPSRDTIAPLKNILEEIIEDYWESVCDFLEPAPCHKAASVPLHEWSFSLKENTPLLAVEGIGHLDQYGTQSAGYMGYMAAPLGCRLQWVSEMR